MKKRCNYCGTIVKCVNIDYYKDDGRGIYCDVCGAFIKIPDIKKNKTRLPAYSRYSRERRRNQYNIIGIVVSIIFLIVFLSGLIIYILFPISPFIVEEEKTTSEFHILDYDTNYEISNEISLNIFVPKNGIDFKDKESIYNLNNFYLYVDNITAINVVFDVRKFDYLWIEINPNCYNKDYDTHIGLILGNNNYNYWFYLNKTIQVVEASFL